MLALWQWADETPSFAPIQKDICTRLTLDSGTVAPLIERMLRAELIQKQSCSVDRRATRISLTATGQNLTAHAKAVPEALACTPELAAWEESTPQLPALPDEALGVLNTLDA